MQIVETPKVNINVARKAEDLLTDQRSSNCVDWVETNPYRNHTAFPNKLLQKANKLQTFETQTATCVSYMRLSRPY